MLSKRNASFFELPNEIVDEIFSYLLIKELLYLEEVSNVFKFQVTNSFIWQKKNAQHFYWAKFLKNKTDFSNQYLKERFRDHSYGTICEQIERNQHAQFCYAAKEGDLTFFSEKTFILPSRLINPDYNGHSPISYARMNNHQHLLDYFYTLYSTGIVEDIRKVVWAIWCHQPLELIKSLIPENVDFNYIRDSTYEPLNLLETAVFNGDKEVVKFLLSKGANLNSVTARDRETIFHQAVKQPKQNSKTIIEIIEILLGHGEREDNLALLNTPNKHGYTPLSDVLKHGDKELISYFLTKLTIVNENLKQIPFHMAAANRTDDVEILKLAMTGLEDINKADINGVTPLYIAIKHQNINMVQALLKLGADFSLKTKAAESCIGMTQQTYMRYQFAKEPQGFNLDDARVRIYFSIEIYKYLKKIKKKSNKEESLDSAFSRFAIWMNLKPSMQELSQAANELFDVFSLPNSEISKALEVFEGKHHSILGKDEKLNRLYQKIMSHLPKNNITIKLG